MLRKRCYFIMKVKNGCINGLREVLYGSKIKEFL